MKQYLLLIILISSLMLLPGIIAQYGYYGYNDISYYLDNPNALFVIIFLIFFAVIFYTLNKSFQNPQVAGVIAVGVSLLIALTLSRRGLLFDMLGNQIGTWILLVVVLLVFAFVVRIVSQLFGTTGTVIAAIALWFMLRSIDPYTFAPELLYSDSFFIFEFFASILGLVLLVVIAFFIGPFLTKKEDPLDGLVKRVLKR